MFKLMKHGMLLLLICTLWQFVFVADASAMVDGSSCCCVNCCTESNYCSQCKYDYLCCGVKKSKVWSVDYRIRRFMNSDTSYQFGTSDGAWTPLSKLDWSLDSTWHGLHVEAVKNDLVVHFEWLTPMGNQIDGTMIDSDWLTPPGTTLDLQTASGQRWRDGQTLDLGTRYQLASGSFEVWPMLGFRFQRFDMYATGVDYIVPPLGPDPQYAGVDVIKFNQQYYQLYLGGQIRKTVFWGNRPIDLMFQGDWAATWGYNVDHHLVREGGDRFTMENTKGDTIHFACGAETPLRGRFRIGLQLDYMQIRTTGSHRLYWPSHSIDTKWYNGVLNQSHQTSLTGYLMACF